MDLATTDNKQFDDHLDDIGGLALFDPKGTKLDQFYSWLNPADNNEWEKLAWHFYQYNRPREDVYVRFVDPRHERFGSIARVQQASYYYYSSTASLTPSQKTSNAKQFAQSKNFSGELRWNGRGSKPYFYNRGDLVEWLPEYKGETVWKFDRDRKKRVTPSTALDKLGRTINIGDFCTYILYQFDGVGAAGIYFGNVTKIEANGKVWIKNVKLQSTDRQAEKEVKDNNLITVLTDDLMRQLMLAKLSNG